MKEVRKTGTFCSKAHAQHSKEWWEARGWKVRIGKTKEGYINYMSKSK